MEDGLGSLGGMKRLAMHAQTWLEKSRPETESSKVQEQQDLLPYIPQQKKEGWGKSRPTADWGEGPADTGHGRG